MKQKQKKRKYITGIFILGFLLLAGCSAPVSTDGEARDTVTPTLPVSMNPIETPEITSTPTPLPTAVPTPTETPMPTATPTVTPTPTEVPVYEQILSLEQNLESAPDIPVKAALLVNMTENKVIYADNAVETIYPASITKLMTALLAFSLESDLTKTVEVSATAVTPVIPSAKMCGFKAGDRLLLQDLLGCMLIYSGNDTSVAVSEHISGSETEFVALMNQKAEELGLTSTHFCNSHGLPDDAHVTSAYDIYLIMQKLFNFEEFLGIIESGSIEVDVLRGESLKTFTFDSTNLFLTGACQVPEGLTILGGKTGTTNKAGCCLVLYVQDAEGSCYIAEIFGSESRETLYPHMVQLLGYISEE